MDAFRAFFHAIHGRHAESLHVCGKSDGRRVLVVHYRRLMAGALANLGQAEKAEPLLATFRGDAYGGPTGLACYFLVRGDIDRAVEWLEKAADQRFACLIICVVRPYEPVFRQSAAWPALMTEDEPRSSLIGAARTTASA